MNGTIAMTPPNPSRREFVVTTAAAVLTSQTAVDPAQAAAAEPSFRDRLVA